jgi:hypothetical protein
MTIPADDPDSPLQMCSVSVQASMRNCVNCQRRCDVVEINDLIHA